MGEALEGEHYCLQHQGNHSHYAISNCTVCTLEDRVRELEQERDELAAREFVGTLADLMKIKPNEMIERIIELEDGIKRHIDRGHDKDCLYFTGNCDCGLVELIALVAEDK